MKAVLAFVFLASLSPATFAAGALVLQDKVPYDKEAVIPSAVRAECQLETKLPAFVREFAQGQFDQIVSTGDKAPQDAMQLDMRITDVIGTGGGAWSGSKSVTIAGKLVKNGQVVGTFKARRLSGGGAWGGYKGTCSILGRCVKTLGKDVANWLQNPGQNDVLGNM